MNYEFIDDIKRYRAALKSESMKANEYTLFDVNKFGSEINFFIDNENQNEMWTSFLTTYSELIVFYKLVNTICQKLKITAFQRESKGETHYVEYTKFIERIAYDSQKKHDAKYVIIVLSKEKNDEIYGIT